MVRCFRRASARTVTAIIPYYGYARQDEKRRPRVPIAASDIAMLLEAAGVDRVLSVDLHSGQIQGQFQHCPVDNLSMFEDFADFFVKHLLPTFPSDSEVAVVSPDADGTARAKFFLGLLIEKGEQFCCGLSSLLCSLCNTDFLYRHALRKSITSSQRTMDDILVVCAHHHGR